MQNAYTWMLMILRKAHISTNTCLHQGFGSIARAHRITTASAPQVATAQRSRSSRWDLRPVPLVCLYIVTSFMLTAAEPDG